MKKIHLFLKKLNIILKSGTFFRFEIATLIGLISIMLFSTAWYVLGSIKSNNKLTNDILDVQEEMISFTYTASNFFSVDIENFNNLVNHNNVKFNEKYIYNILKFSNYLNFNTHYDGIDSILHKKTVLYYNFINTINYESVDDSIKYGMVALNTEYNMAILSKILSSNGKLKEISTAKVLKITEQIRENHIKLLVIFTIISPLLFLCIILIIYDLKKIYKEKFRKEEILNSLIHS
jgi:hypothetical protein